MDSNSFHQIDAIKMEKQKALQRYNTFNKISNIVRTLEILLAISLLFYLLSLSSTYVPSAMDFSRAFLRRVFSLVFSPHFVFLIGNAIIVTLFAKSSAEKTAENSGEDVDIFHQVTENVSAAAAAATAATRTAVDHVAEEERCFEEKTYRRTKSSAEMAVVVKEVVTEEKKELRRSVTEVRRGEKYPVEEKMKREKIRFKEDELSNEEFQKRVEAFIEKQQRLLREESLAVIVSN